MFKQTNNFQTLFLMNHARAQREWNKRTSCRSTFKCSGNGAPRIIHVSWLSSILCKNTSTWTERCVLTSVQKCSRFANTARQPLKKWSSCLVYVCEHKAQIWTSSLNVSEDNLARNLKCNSRDGKCRALIQRYEGLHGSRCIVRNMVKSSSAFTRTRHASVYFLNAFCYNVLPRAFGRKYTCLTKVFEKLT